MNEPLKMEPLYRKAAYRVVWFGAAFALVCAALAMFSWAGILVQPDYAPMLFEMALIGAALFTFGWIIIRFFRV